MKNYEADKKYTDIKIQSLAPILKEVATLNEHKLQGDEIQNNHCHGIYGMSLWHIFQIPEQIIF